MYQYIWDPETGGLLLQPERTKFSKEPRPVYYQELDMLGFDKYFDYPKNIDAPIMWAESNNYFYRGEKVARTKGGSYYTAPTLDILMDPDFFDQKLQPIDVKKMVEKNSALLETLAQETIKTVYNTYTTYKKKIDMFYVAFSGGKDSVVAFDIVQRALPHSDFVVIFGNTKMEFPDTYKVIEAVQQECDSLDIMFYKAESVLDPTETWNSFGPPSTSNRWCCSVHKTSPQINLLRDITGKRNFTGMAFTGVRSEESLSRSTYDTISDGRKHNGQMSCHTILDWTSAEVFLYIFSRHLVLNEAYKKGNARAGCLVCPNSSGKHEYIKRCSYTDEVDHYLDIISATSGKVTYSSEELRDFIDAGYWRTRKSGRELNFGYDTFEVITGKKPPQIDIYQPSLNWQMWGQTIGDITQVGDNEYTVFFRDKNYLISVLPQANKCTIVLSNCENTKDDIKFQSLFKSVVIKSLYCIGCGECEAECKFDCIDMRNGVTINTNCVHCYKCHDVRSHCLRYASIRNRVMEVKKMAGLDRYFTFGTRSEWVETFLSYHGGEEFWISDGNGQVANKKKDAFRNFSDDAGLTYYDKTAKGDKYTKCLPTPLTKMLSEKGLDEQSLWALLLCNLVYSPAYNWFVKNLKIGMSYTPEMLMLLLQDVMENDTKGKGKRNVVDALKITMTQTPLGTTGIFAICDYTEKRASSGQTSVTLNSLTRTSWANPNPKVILYSLYLFAENCGDYYQFSLSTLLDDSIERDGVSPTQIFGIDYSEMIPLLNGLTVNYPDWISANFSLGLDTINLNPEKKAEDVFDLF